jgi:hypothetical protein
MTPEVKAMIDNIPAEVRWNIATLAATSTETALDAAILAAVGPDKRKEILTQVYTRIAPGIKLIIDTLGLPTDNVEKIANAVLIANTITLGPEMQAEVVEAGPKKIVAKVTGCAFANRMKEIGVALDCHPVCSALHEATYKAINPDLKFSFKGKCLSRGDSYCGELTVEM